MVGEVESSSQISEDPTPRGDAEASSLSVKELRLEPQVSNSNSKGVEGTGGSLESDSGPRRYKIYTKTGDRGSSSLYNGERRRKDDSVFMALGDVDELNSGLGLAHEYCHQLELSDICHQIENIQSRLLDVGSALATPLDKSSARKVERVKFDQSAVENIERWIDSMDEALPPLTNFILPSGGLAASQLHVARSLCRRAERRVVPLVDSDQVDFSVGQYLNRISDYLFTAARTAAAKSGRQETVYKKA